MAADFNHLRRICDAAHTSGVVPGLVVAIGAGGQVVFVEAFGRRSTTGAAPATPETVYDVASLTKALVTTTLAMRAVARGALALEDRLPALLGRDLAGDRAAVTLRQLLAHGAGFPAHRPYWERVRGGTAPAREAGDRVSERFDARTVVDACAAEPLVYAPGTRSIYSDVGFILLGAAIERALGVPLDELFERELRRPLGLAATGFVRLPRDAGAAPFAGRPVAPTEACAVRGRVMAGEVHDLNAHAMGGVAGHAGLFSDAGGVMAIARALVAAWRGASDPAGAAPLVPRDVVRAFWSPAGIPGSTWRLGWDGPAPAGSLAGDRIARAAVGHLAFTGCSLWIDPEREAFVVLLSNRVHPAVRDDPRFRDLRRAVNDAALDAIGYKAGP